MSERRLPPQKENEQAVENMSRRVFLKNAAIALGASVAGAAFGPKAWETGWNQFGAEKLQSEIQRLETELSKKYGILIRVWKPDPEIHPASARKQATSLEDHSLYLAYQGLLSLQRELLAYPPHFIHENISGIDLVYTMTPPESVASEGGVQQAVTTFGGNITFSIARGSVLETHRAVFSNALEPEVVHHEIAHIFTNEIQEEQWIQLHPNAGYVGAEWNRRASELPVGFAMPYGRKSAYEDMATVAELLFVDEETMRKKIQNDPILERKVHFMQKVYAQRTGGKMNDAFWKDWRCEHVSESYW